MKIRVNPHNVEIIREQTEPINEKEIKVSKCEFEFDDKITNDFVKEAYFTLNGETYKQIIQNNECEYPSEVLDKKGTLEIGVVAYKVENEQEIQRYNPSPDYFESWVGSLKDAENSEPITPSEMEQFEQQLQNGLNDIEEAIENAERLDIDANKVGKITSITITKQDGTTQTVTLEDGMGLDYNWLGTSLGIKREDEQEYVYVDLKGEKGDAGAINMLIVNELPATGQEDTIYLVPLEEPESQENRYAEYVYINNAWELLGKIGIEVDLTDYYTKTETNTLLNGKVGFTDYATNSTGGVIKTHSTYGTSVDSNGRLRGTTNTYEQYQSANTLILISKATLDNVITGKALETANNKVTSISSSSTDTQYPSAKCVYDLIGNLETILTTLDIGGGAS